MTSLRLVVRSSIISGAVFFAHGPVALHATPRADTVARVVVNDNRRPAGRLKDGVLTLRLDARLGDWHPDGEDAPGATVPAFAEEGGPARIPGPLIRVPAGTEIALTIRRDIGFRIRAAHGRQVAARGARVGRSVACNDSDQGGNGQHCSRAVRRGGEDCSGSALCSTSTLREPWDA